MCLNVHIVTCNNPFDVLLNDQLCLGLLIFFFFLIFFGGGVGCGCESFFFFVMVNNWAYLSRDRNKLFQSPVNPFYRKNIQQNSILGKVERRFGLLVYQLVSRRRYDRRKKALEENEKKVSITHVVRNFLEELQLQGTGRCELILNKGKITDLLQN